MEEDSLWKVVLCHLLELEEFPKDCHALWMNGFDKIGKWKDLYKLYVSSPLCEKSLSMNMLDTCDLIGEIVFVTHKENIFNWMNKILKNCPYVKLELLIQAFSIPRNESKCLTYNILYYKHYIIIH